MLTKSFPLRSSFPIFSFPLSCLFFFDCLRRNNEFTYIKLKLSSSSKISIFFASIFSAKKSQTLAFKDYYTNWCNTLQKTLLPPSHSQIYFFIFFTNPHLLSRRPPPQPFSFILRCIRQCGHPRKPT